jgi:N-acetylglucosaminyldiphosphoundecaprenol N-acetyl-beta-D-mannosaminyltransferase
MIVKKKIISVDVNFGSKKDYLNLLVEFINKKTNAYVCFCNVHMLIEAYDDSSFASVVNNAKIVFADGFPIAKSFKWLYKLDQERINGMDFLPHFLSICNQHNYKVAIVGSTNEVLDIVDKKIKVDYGNVEITNLISPPFGKPWKNSEYIDKINKTKTDVVFVALGCPKQERWMNEHYKQIDAVLFGIGGALPTYAEVVKRAPVWMQKNGLEWFYRLLMEPRRMFKRYLYTNFKFLYLLCLEKLNKS